MAHDLPGDNSLTGPNAIHKLAKLHQGFIDEEPDLDKTRFRTAPQPWTKTLPVKNPLQPGSPVELKTVSYVYQEFLDIDGNWQMTGPIRDLATWASTDERLAEHNWRLLNAYQAKAVVSGTMLGIRDALTSASPEKVLHRFVSAFNKYTEADFLDEGFIDAPVRYSYGIPIDERLKKSVRGAHLGDKDLDIFIALNGLEPVKDKTNISVYMNPLQAASLAIDNDGDYVRIYWVRDKATGKVSYQLRQFPKANVINLKAATNPDGSLMTARDLMIQDIQRLRPATGQGLLETLEAEVPVGGGTQKRTGGTIGDALLEQTGLGEGSIRDYIQSGIRGLKGSGQNIGGEVNTLYQRFYDSLYLESAIAYKKMLAANPTNAHLFRSDPRMAWKWRAEFMVDYIKKHGFDVLEIGDVSGLTADLKALDTAKEHWLLRKTKRLAEKSPEQLGEFLTKIFDRAESNGGDFSQTLLDELTGANVSEEDFVRARYRLDGQSPKPFHFDEYTYGKPSNLYRTLTTRYAAGDTGPFALLEVQEQTLTNEQVAPALRKLIKGPALVSFRSPTGELAPPGGRVGNQVTVYGMPMGISIGKDPHEVGYHTPQEMIEAQVLQIESEAMVEGGSRLFGQSTGRFSLQNILRDGPYGSNLYALARANNLTIEEAWLHLNRGTAPNSYLEMLVRNHDMQNYKGTFNRIRGQLKDFLSQTGRYVAAELEDGKFKLDHRILHRLAQRFIFDPGGTSESAEQIGKRGLVLEGALHEAHGTEIMGAGLNVLEPPDKSYKHRFAHGYFHQYMGLGGRIKQWTTRASKNAKSNLHTAFTEEDQVLLLADFVLDDEFGHLGQDPARRYKVAGEGLMYLTRTGFDDLEEATRTMHGPVASMYDPRTGEVFPRVISEGTDVKLAANMVDAKISVIGGPNVAGIITHQEIGARGAIDQLFAEQLAASRGISVQEAQQLIVRAMKSPNASQELQELLDITTVTIGDISGADAGLFTDHFAPGTKVAAIRLRMGFDRNIGQRMAPKFAIGGDMVAAHGLHSGEVMVPQLDAVLDLVRPYVNKDNHDEIYGVAFDIVQEQTNIQLRRLANEAAENMAGTVNPIAAKLSQRLVDAAKKGRLDGQMAAALEQKIFRLLG